MKQLLHTRLVKLRFGAYQFNPGIITTLVTIVFLYIMISMGLWQLERAAYKDNLQNKIAERQYLDPIDSNALPDKRDQRIFLPVRFFGVFDDKHPILYDNRIVDGRAGYDVYSLFIRHDRQAVLVNRGWVPLGRTRDDLPDLSVPTEKTEITGLLDNPPSKSLILAEHDLSDTDWPLILQYIDLEEIEQATGHELYDMILWLEPGSEYGFRYNLPVFNLNSAKNTGYAFQWFAMSAALLIIYLVVNTKKRSQ